MEMLDCNETPPKEGHDSKMITNEYINQLKKAALGIGLAAIPQRFDEWFNSKTFENDPTGYDHEMIMFNKKNSDKSYGIITYLTLFTWYISYLILILS